MRYPKRNLRALLPKTYYPILFIVVYSIIAIVVMTAVACSLSPLAQPQQLALEKDEILEPLAQVFDDEAEVKRITSTSDSTSDSGSGSSSSSSSGSQNLAQLESKSAIITAGEESAYPKVFYRGNTADCGMSFDFDFNHDGDRDGIDGDSGDSPPINKAAHWLAVTEWTRLPMYANGAAAGPFIADCTPSMVMNNECDVKQKFDELEVVKALREGKAFQFFLPLQPPEKSNAVVATRARMSSSTGVVFLDENHLAVASYGMQKVYLYEYHLQTQNQTETETSDDTSETSLSYARLLDSVDATGNPDLMDVDLERKLLVVSQLKMGSQFLFKYDLERGTLSQYKEVEAFGPAVRDQWCHEAAFYPSVTSSVIAASSSRWPLSDTLMVSLFDYEREVVIAQYMMQSHDMTKGYKAQGIRFIDERHFIADLTRQHVDGYNQELMCQKITSIPKNDDKQNRMALFRLNFSVDDIVSGKVEGDRPVPVPASSGDFTVMDVYDMGVGAFDGIAYHKQNATAIVADQLNDRVLVFKVDINADKPLSFVAEHHGYIMPHGVAISPMRNHVAVTAYGDNSVIVQPMMPSIPGMIPVQNVEIETTTEIE